MDASAGPVRRWLLAAGVAALVWAFLVVGGVASASSVAARDESLVERRFTRRDGLPAGAVHAIAQTRDGHLWLGTSEGLVRFDGSSFVLFDRARIDGLPGMAVGALQAARDGGLWIGFDHGGGAAKLHAGGDRLDAVPLGSTVGEVRALVERGDGVVAVATDAGVFVVEGGRAGALPGLPSEDVRALATDGAGRLWAATARGLAVEQAGRFAPRAGDGGDGDVTALAADGQGGLVAGGARLQRLGPEGELVPLAAPAPPAVSGGGDPAPALPAVSALLAGPGGTIFAGTWGGGVVRLGEGGARVPLGQEGDGPIRQIRALCLDAEGTLWVGTSGGLVELRPGRFPRVRLGGAGAPPVALLPGEGGGLRVVTRDGAVLPGDGGAPPPGGAAIASALIDETGAVWRIAADGALFRSPTLGTPGAAVSLPPGARPAFDHGARQVWAVGRAALWRWRSDRFEPRPLPPGGSRLPASTRLHVLAGKSGALWIAGGAAVAEVREGSVRVHALGSEGAGSVTALHEDDRGDLWIATLGAGCKWLSQGQLFSFTTRHGLVSDRIFTLGEEDGRLWMSGARGIWSVAKDALHAIAAGRASRVQPAWFTARDGVDLAGLAHPWPGSLRTGDGRLWFLTAAGAVGVTRLPAPPPSPGVQIARVLVGGTPVPAPVPIESSIVVPPGAALEVAFRPLSLLGPEAVRLRYRLAGLGRAWTDVTGAGAPVSFAQLPAGTYALEVEAIGRESAGPGPRTRLGVVVERPFYATVWFLGACLAAVGLATFGAHRLRLGRVRREAQAVIGERTRIAREIHDTLAQSMVAVARRLECAGRALPSPSPAAEHVAAAREAIRVGLAEARRSVWAMRTEGGAEPLHALRDIARHLAADSGVRIDVAGAWPALPERTAHALVRIGQEAMTNALRHGRPSHVAVHASVEGGRARLSVTDDGRGFDTAQPGGTLGRGLVGMGERAEELGGALSVRSAPGQGTAIVAEVPL